MGELLVHFRQGEKVDLETRTWILGLMEKNGGHNGDIEADLNTCYSFFYDISSVRAFARKYDIPTEWLNVTDEDANLYDL